MAVGYVYQIRNPEVPQVDQTLRANLRGASLMPLVGFLTPELRWVHGFWGPTDARKFSGDISTARQIYPVRTARVQAPPVPGRGEMTAVVNEFGECHHVRGLFVALGAESRTACVHVAVRKGLVEVSPGAA